MRSNRNAFTLVEILVVIGLILLLTVMVVAAFRTNASEKIRSGARTLQSAILGARDRALHAGAQNPTATNHTYLSRRGFRITRDPNDTNIGTGIVYCQPLEPQIISGLSADQLDLNSDGTPDVIRISGLGSEWNGLSVAGFFPTNPRVWFPYPSGTRAVGWTNALPAGGPYTSVDIYPAGSAVIGNVGTGLEMQFEVYNEVLPNSVPIALPSGIVIDIPNSSPAAKDDLMFSPRGGIGGVDAASGPIHFLLRDVRDVMNGVDPAKLAPNYMPNAIRTDLIITLFPQTGHVGTFDLSLIDSNADLVADDIFAYAKAGSAAGR